MEWDKKNAKESTEVINDLHLILKHINEKEGKYLLLLKARKKINDKITNLFIDYHNLNYAELFDIYMSFVNLVKRELKNEAVCNCDKCKNAENILNKIMKMYEFKSI